MLNELQTKLGDNLTLTGTVHLPEAGVTIIIDIDKLRDFEFSCKVSLEKKIAELHELYWQSGRKNG